MKIISWNVNGIRAIAKKGFLQWLMHESPDILCLQETKAQQNQLSDDIENIPGYTSYWESGERKGYSGVSIYTKQVPLKLKRGFGLKKEFDSEGRILICEYPKFILLNIYFPNGGRDDTRLKYKLNFYDATLKYCELLRAKGRELIVAGDFNTAHNEIDLSHPKENEDVSGFLRIERDWLDKIEKYGYIDTFRKLYPTKTNMYTWWSLRTAARGRNIGWRLDYFYLTPKLFKKVEDSIVLSNVMGSDHCPIRLDLKV